MEGVVREGFLEEVVDVEKELAGWGGEGGVCEGEGAVLADFPFCTQ